MTFDTLSICAMPLASIGSAALGWLMFFLSIFLILLVLVQRGKGGGLTGALGGPGGQSAFGSKAGDTFTVITAVSAIVWGVICAIAMYTLGVPPLSADDEFPDDPPSIVSTEEPSKAIDSFDFGTPGSESGASSLTPGIGEAGEDSADESTNEDPADGESPEESAEPNSGDGETATENDTAAGDDTAADDQ